MKILITGSPLLEARATANWKEGMKEIAGQWVEVETEYLFDNQYNITTPSGIGLRIMQEYVMDVQDDARIGKGRCSYCGKVSEWQGIELCSKCGHYGYFKPFKCQHEDHSIKVNSNWKIEFTTQFGGVTPHGYAHFNIINTKTNEVIRAEKWQYWSDVQIEKEVPQVVKNKLRSICSKHGESYRGYHVGAIVERTWNKKEVR